ncbi:flagellar biosynthesis anti-sigma factor FlgM [Enterobacillus tribolii]|uniref:Negative regulator of flagellin synthesis n=1 Tax=Enterobacillus tribolii TaxID=1487935 RepID=A0A370R2Y1_9GAMM|nr:flagellar biosynthesis anti-sigma factor FlgM [Enterobacillus tribolii]MBW7984767.1 anti-sigma-28 factor FlgM [Enterobacillus tribolii]RDK96768.1 FlgM family anti-sigma-28 factor [Enterobacillus tribolii]
MSIERTSPLPPINPIQSRENAEIAAPKSRNASLPPNTDAAQVTLSDAQSRLMRSGPQDINQKRVDEVKAAIERGELEVDTGKIADALLRDTYDFLNGGK